MYLHARTSFYTHWYYFYTIGAMYLHARMFCTLTHTSSIPMGAMYLCMQEHSVHSLIRLLYHRCNVFTSKNVLNTRSYNLFTGFEKVPISPWLVTLLHICGVIPTPQSPISPKTPETLRDCRAERRRHRAERRCLRIEHRYCHIEWWVFHDVSQCFKSVSQCFKSVSQCFKCFMFY